MPGRALDDNYFCNIHEAPAPAPAPYLFRAQSEPSPLRVEEHHSEPAGVIFYITRDSQYGASDHWRRVHDFRQSSRKAAAVQARIVAKPPTVHLPFIRRGVVEVDYFEPAFAISSDQLSTTKSVASTSRINKVKTAAVEGTEVTEETIRGMLEKYGIEAKPSLSGRVFKFAQYENRAHNFFAVDRVPANAKWGTDKHVNELTLKDKPIYVWIVGVVATCRLYDHEKQAHPANVSIEIDPVSSTVLAKAKHFLGRVCNTPSASNNRREKRDVISATKSMMDNSLDTPTVKLFTNIFDGRADFNSETKAEKNKISNKKIASGDLVLVEAIVTRRRMWTSQPQLPLSGNQKQEPYQASFTLVDVILLADRSKSKAGDLVPNLPPGVHI